MNVKHPEVLWAQRSDKVYLTVSLPDAKDISIDFQPNGLFSFSAVGAQGEPFHFTLQLYGAIVPEEERVWWRRLLKTEEKPAPYIKVDWNRWCDEDDEEAFSEVASDVDNAELDEDEDENSDEGMLYLPDLEKAR